jgi:hypothetical protein
MLPFDNVPGFRVPLRFPSNDHGRKTLLSGSGFDQLLILALPDLLDTRGEAFEIMEGICSAILLEGVNVFPDCPIHIGIDVFADIIEGGR